MCLGTDLWPHRKEVQALPIERGRKSPLVFFRQPRGDWWCAGAYTGRPAGVSDLTTQTRMRVRDRRGRTDCLPLISSTDMNHGNPWLTPNVLTDVDSECVECKWRHVCRSACCGSRPVRLHLNTSAGLFVVFCSEKLFPVNPDIAHLIQCIFSDEDL